MGFAHEAYIGNWSIFIGKLPILALDDGLVDQFFGT
jgi:hypothetical protein